MDSIPKQETRKKKTDTSSGTRQPKPAQELYVPGSRRRAAPDEYHQKQEVEAPAPDESTEEISSELKYLRDIQIILEEYLDTYDAEEAAACVKELSASEFHHLIVRSAINLTFAKNEGDRRELISKLFSVLYAEQQLTPEQLAKGLNEILANIEDTEIDVPFASKCVGAFIGYAVTDEILPLAFLQNALDHLVNSGKALAVAAAAFSVIAQNESFSAEELETLYKESGVDFMNFLKEDCRNLEYLEKYLQEQGSKESRLPALLKK